MNYELLKKQIKYKGYTIEQIATKIGVTRNGLSTTIKNDTLKVRDLEKICKILEVDINIFFGRNSLSSTSISGDNNVQGVNSAINQNQNQSEVEMLKAENKYLKKEIKELKERLKASESDKEMFKRIIESKIGG